ncbi:MAG TPA: O-antigen ligase family protein [Candidatus Angelobacter sp.]|nr:O-antigen ligase family protein [Candidatus Angelobacter sp.]
MALKDLIALCLIALAIPASVTVLCFSERTRDAAFVCMTFGSAITDKLDVNFVTRYWYRGTTRGFEFTVVDILAIAILVSILLAPRAGQPRWFWPAGLGAMMFYSLYCCFSVAISDPKLFGLFELSKVARGILIFLAAAMFVRTERELGLLVLAVGCAVCFEGALSFRQRYLMGIYRVTGNLDHANSLSMFLCTVAPVFVAAATSNLHRLIRVFSCLCLGVAAATILLTISRAGIPTFALVVLGAAAWCVSLRITLRKILASLLVCLLAGGLVYKSWDTLKERFTDSPVETEYSAEQFESRAFYFWIAKEILSDRFFGVGLNNWSWWVSTEYGPRLGVPYEGYPSTNDAPSKESLAGFVFAPPAHNLGVLTAGELGWPGLIVFAFVWLRWFWIGAGFLWRRSPAAMHRMGTGFLFSICGIFLQSLTEWVYHQTQILFTFHILLGALASLRYAKRRHARSLPESAGIEQEPAVFGEATQIAAFAR